MSRKAFPTQFGAPGPAKRYGLGGYPTPLKSVRLTCLYCGHTDKGVKACDGKGEGPDSEYICSLHPLRFGRRQVGTSPIKAMRKRCLWCMNQSAASVEDCAEKDCPSWGYRFGMSPGKAKSLGKNV